MTPSLVVATLNLHAGVDGWGRPFNVDEAVRACEADVVVLAENWQPDGASSLAAVAAESLGYDVFEQALATGRRAKPHPDADHRWMKALDWRGNSHAVYLDSERAIPQSVVRSQRFIEAEPGSWGVALLSRLPVQSRSVVDLGVPPRDRTRRAALVLQVAVAGRSVLVIGTHMTHLTYGSPWQFTRLNRLLSDVTHDDPAVLAGDMNLWGPPTRLLMRGWRHTVTGRTWPAWRPHSQIDHILVKGLIDDGEGRVLPAFGSDHRAIRVELHLAP